MSEILEHVSRNLRNSSLDHPLCFSLSLFPIPSFFSSLFFLVFSIFTLHYSISLSLCLSLCLSISLYVSLSLSLCAFDARATDGRGRRQRGALVAGRGRVDVQCEPDGEIRARLGHGGLAGKCECVFRPRSNVEPENRTSVLDRVLCSFLPHGKKHTKIVYQHTIFPSFLFSLDIGRSNSSRARAVVCSVCHSVCPRSISRAAAADSRTARRPCSSQIS